MTAVPRDERAHAVRVAVEHGICTKREVQILNWWAAGVGIRRTAIALGLHESTVRTHRARAIDKIDRLLASENGARVS